MRGFVITTDSAMDMPKSYLEEKGIPAASLSYIMDGVTYKDLEGLSHKEFFDRVRNGAMPTTSQVNPDEARDMFQAIVDEGNDILHIAFSSGLSGSYNSARIAAEELMEEHPEAKIVVIDSLCASLGQGMLLYKAVEMKEQGKNLDEIAAWVEENKLHVHHGITVDDLNHLHRGGRVSKASAVIGTMVKIKPILSMDSEGKLAVISKERGRKKSLNVLVDMMEKNAEGYENDIIMITHGDCEEDAEYVRQQVEERFGIKKFIINGIGSVIGSHTGAGVVGLLYFGKER